ncbi:MAG TPA: YafY family protein [Rhizomicrobium sp.]|jgi:predicted DNA-binding transcriptional regulator YafY
MLASRLLSILMLLQARGRMSAAALAAEFEVSVRTIHRDIDQLSAAGVPVYADRGRSGGFQLQDGYRTKLTGLTEPEAEALFLAGLPGPAAELGLAEFLSTARLKLLAALPANVQPGADRIAARFHLDATAWFRDNRPLPALPVIANAVWRERMLTLRYRRAGQDGIVDRRLGPLGLVLKGGTWYLVAQSGKAGGKAIRTYRAENIHDAALTDEPFVRPKDFDLAAYWAKSSRAYEAGVFREQAQVRLSPRGLSRLELLGPHVLEAASKTAGKPDKNGWVRCTLPIENADVGARELMRLGDEVEVLEPPALRAHLHTLLSDMAKRHRRAKTKA